MYHVLFVKVEKHLYGGLVFSCIKSLFFGTGGNVRFLLSNQEILQPLYFLLFICYEIRSCLMRVVLL